MFPMTQLFLYFLKNLSLSTGFVGPQTSSQTNLKVGLWFGHKPKCIFPARAHP